MTDREIAELRALIEKRAWTHADDYRIRQLVPALIDLAAEVNRAKDMVSDLEPVPLSAGEPDGMETTAEERAQWNSYDPQTQPTGWLTPLARAARDFDRLSAEITRLDVHWQASMDANSGLCRKLAEVSARETKAREEEREACALLADEVAHISLAAENIAAAIRARSKS